MQLISHSDIVADAITSIQEMDAERSDSPIGLISRFPRLNMAIKKHFRFANIYALAGNSGGGKSYTANMLRTDFTDLIPLEIPIKGIEHNVIDYVLKKGQFTLKNDTLYREPLNGDFKEKVILLHFGYEMQNKWEFIRTLATLTGYAFDYLLSSHVVQETPTGEFLYNKISDNELLLSKRILKQYVMNRDVRKKGNAIMLTFPIPGTLNEFFHTIAKYAKAYPEYRMIVTNDHTLLHNKGDGITSDQELVDEGIKVLIKIRDRFNAMVLPIVQTNSEMEKDDRVLNPQLHYPTKRDLYRGGQFYQGCDFVMMQVMPENFRIENYGPLGINAKLLIHLSLIKTRMGRGGHLWFKNRLDEGRIVTAIANEISGELDVMKNLLGY